MQRAPEARPEGGEDEAIFRPVFRVAGGYYVVVLILASIVAWGLFAWLYQLKNGLGVTGLGRPNFWGIYIVNFVFFIGISHAGTLVSAILRVSHAEWRRPITRAAEAITVFALMIGPLNVLFDQGRVDRVLHIFQYGRFQSPLLWDVMSIGTYFTFSIIYLYVPMIPDIAMLRDRTSPRDPRKRLYQLLSLGWRGTESQKRRLNRAINILMVGIIPIAVSVHTVVSWVMAMTVQPMWHSAIFGPYFVVGAIFSGIASILIAMAILRRVFHLEAYLTKKHFSYLGLLLLAFVIFWTYFTLNEYLTTAYGNEPSEMSVLASKVWGEFAWLFWTMAFSCLFIPFFILAFPQTRTIAGTVVASILINIGMWIERYTIIVPTLTDPRLPLGKGNYAPTWVEWSITAAEFAGLALLYVLFVRFFPIISIWEVREGREREEREAEKAPAPHPEEAVPVLRR